MADNEHTIGSNLKSLNEALLRLENRELSVAELDNVVDDAKNLYEQFVVLRYKAMEQVAEKDAADTPVPPPTPTEEDKEEDTKEEAGFSGFRLDIPKPSSKNQIEKKKPSGKGKKLSGKQESIPVPDQPLPFNSPSIFEEKKEEPQEEVQTEETPVPENQTNLMDAIDEETVASLNEKFQRDDSATLASKLGKTPISDLKAAIGINQKFLYMNDLFEGEHDAFHEAVDSLNRFDNYQQALDYINKELIGKFKWEKDSKSVASFMNLVERRYL